MADKISESAGAADDLVQVLRLAYPDGVPGRDYFPLLALLAETAYSSRSIASWIAALSGGNPGRHYYELVHELPDQAVPESEKTRVRQLLDQVGYADWLQRSRR
jgi:Protein of unknown function (DUF3349)